MFEQFIEDFLSINPHPTQQQVEWLKQSIGVSDFDCPDFCSEVLGQAYKRAKLCALTESERVLINDYNPALTETDNLLMNDGDNFTPPEKLGNQDALRIDGIEEDNPSIQELEVYNAGN